MRRLLIVGFGDIASRMVPLLRGRYRLFALARSTPRAAQMRAMGVTPVVGDLDHPASLYRLGGLSHDVLHLAPPPATGTVDTRTTHLLRALAGRGTLPQRLVYLSTSGVYGDRAGAVVRESDPLNAQTERGRLRVDAERQLRRWGRALRSRVCILRVPGIYGHDRLPLDRLRRGTPSLVAEEDSYTNHVHADDLALLVMLALNRGQASRAYHASDGQWMKAGDYFDAVADAFDLPRPRRIARAQAAVEIPANALSFLLESRRLCNRRMLEELHAHLRYPTVAHTLSQIKPK